MKTQHSAPNKLNLENIFMMGKTGITLSVLLAAVLGCKHAKPKQTSVPPRKPAPFAESSFTSVTPTADGGAYAVGFDSGLWYIRGSEAVKVRFPDEHLDADTLFDMLEITPSVDGGAYAQSLGKNSFWFLHEATAEKVLEVPSLSSKPGSSRISAFPLYISERKKRLEADHELEERPNPEDIEPEPDQ